MRLIQQRGREQKREGETETDRDEGQRIDACVREERIRVSQLERKLEKEKVCMYCCVCIFVCMRVQ